MHKFSLITGAGHCGTMWLSQVMNDRPDMVGYHERRQTMLKKSWPVAAQVPINALELRPYFNSMRHLLRTTHVVDSNSWAPFEIPSVHRQILVDRVIYLVRNGVQQVYSLYKKSNAWGKLPLDHFVFDVWLRNFWMISRKPGPTWEDWGRFERICLLWAATPHMVEWLTHRGLAVSLVRLETLTEDIETLRYFAPGVPDVALESWQQTDVNRKVTGNRHPNWLWSRFKKDEKQKFLDICGTSMVKYGYELPEV